MRIPGNGPRCFGNVVVGVGNGGGRRKKRVGAGARNFCVGVERVTSASGSYPREGEGEGGGVRSPGARLGDGGRSINFPYAELAISPDGSPVRID